MSEDEYRALVEQAHQMEELQKHPGWAVFEDYIQHGPGGVAFKAREVLSGHMKDWDRYNHMTGWVQGANHCLSAAATVRAMVDNVSHEFGAVEANARSGS